MELITIEGKNGIKATILADSLSDRKDGREPSRLITLEIEYPRIVLAEANTHRILSKNSFSSRAVPFAKMVQQLDGKPVRFGANQGGMQDKGEDYDKLVEGRPIHSFAQLFESWSAEEAWEQAKKDALFWAEAYMKAGYHKQVYNRLLEPFQMMKTVISGTEWANFLWLRDHEAADPTFAELARVIRGAIEASTPTLLQPGEWHLPYVDWCRVGSNNVQSFYLRDEDTGEYTWLSLDDAIKISCARCAAVSYRNEGYGIEKSREVYEKLVGADRKHASAFEHQATPMRPYGFYEGAFGSYESNKAFVPFTWEEGITHVDRKGQMWSGNFKSFIQYRKLIPGENYEG